MRGRGLAAGIIVAALLAFAPADAKKCPEVSGVAACAEAGQVRLVDVSFDAGRETIHVIGVVFDGAEATANGPATAQHTTACIVKEQRFGYWVYCGAPLTVTIDQQLSTAKISGSARTPFGRVHADISATGGAPATPGADVSQGGGASCTRGGFGAESSSVPRTGEATGSLSFERGQSYSASSDLPADAYMALFASSDGVFRAPNPTTGCAPSSPRGYLFSCGGIGVIIIGVCSAGEASRNASTELVRGKTLVDVFGSESSSTSFDPQGGGGPADSQSACVFVRHPKEAFGICETPFNVTVDPVLRTARIKGTFESFDDFGPHAPPQFRGPPEINVDLRFTASSGTPGLDPTFGGGEETYCGFGVADAEGPSLTTPASVLGSVTVHDGTGTLKASSATTASMSLGSDFFAIGEIDAPGCF